MAGEKLLLNGRLPSDPARDTRRAKEAIDRSASSRQAGRQTRMCTDVPRVTRLTHRHGVRNPVRLGVRRLALVLGLPQHRVGRTREGLAGVLDGLVCVRVLQLRQLSRRVLAAADQVVELLGRDAGELLHGAAGDEVRPLRAEDLAPEADHGQVLLDALLEDRNAQQRALRHVQRVPAERQALDVGDVHCVMCGCVSMGDDKPPHKNTKNLATSKQTVSGRKKGRVVAGRAAAQAGAHGPAIGSDAATLVPVLALTRRETTFRCRGPLCAFPSSRNKVSSSCDFSDL